MFKNQKPTTPSIRHSFLCIKKISKHPLLKNKLQRKKKALGKNNQGHVVSRHKENGCKKRYRKLELAYSKNLNGIVCSIEYDPFRTGFIMSVFDTEKKTFFYTVAPSGLQVGSNVLSGAKVPVKVGNSMPLKSVPPGTLVSNVTLHPKNRKSVLARSAGSYCFLLGHLIERNLSFLELMSGEIRLVSSDNQASIGKVSNESHFLEQSGKAGRSRWLGKRPKVRGVAMNPIDHPNGGGEGKKSGLNRTPWGKSSKQGVKTGGFNPMCVKKRNESK